MNRTLQEIKEALIHSKSLPEGEKVILRKEAMLLLRNLDTRETNTDEVFEMIDALKVAYPKEFEPFQPFVDGLRQTLGNLKKRDEAKP